ncbi:MAG: CoA transferase [Betaproteobacteria bacterium]|nr:CoA transferase [Betaproteobacteria bacterium]
MLAGLRVIDVTSHLAGPYCTWLLGELGADVIKVERPEGDPSRAVGPFANGQSLYFSSINRAKRSVVLDLKSDEGAEIFSRLIRSADVLVENLRPGAFARLGFPPERLAGLNPRLVYASITGFGQDGPLSDRPAFDIVVQAMSGMMSMTGPEGGEPVRVGVSIGDLAAGLFSTIDILAALFARGREAGGRRLDISMLDCQLALMENAVSRYLNAGEVPTRLGGRHPSIVPFQTFPASDGTIVVAADGDAAWVRLCQAIGLGALAHDARFASAEGRVAHQAALQALLDAQFRQRPGAEWLQLLAAANVASGPLNTVPEALAAPQVAARRMISEVPGPDGGALRFVSAPVGRRGASSRAAPRLGEHTDEVLGELGWKRGEAGSARTSPDTERDREE